MTQAAQSPVQKRADFIPGKPVRLRGLGKRVGPWQGDLYLKLNSQ